MPTANRTMPVLLSLLTAAAMAGCNWFGSDDRVAAPSALAYSSPQTYTVGTAITGLNPTVTGTVTSFGVAPALPAGLALNTISGQISGTPTAVAAAANYVVTASNSTGSTTASLSITVNPAAPSNLAYNSPQTYTVGAAITALNPTVTGTVASYSVTPALPAGLTLNTTSGQISGTPTVATTQATYTVRATNVSGFTSFGLVASVIVASVSTVIGPAGGTITGPDGVQVVVPAGALGQQTTIGIARSSIGAPALPAEGNAPASAIYEFTPHDVVFNTPVTIRVPAPVNGVSTEVFMASLGADWQLNDATLVGGFVEWRRNSFSWSFSPGFCQVSPSNSNPYPCVYPSGRATASATPASAITQVLPGFYNGNAGSWTVNQAATVSLTLRYAAAPDCGINGNALTGQVKLLRLNNLALPLNAPGRITTLFDAAVALVSTAVTVPSGSTASTGTGGGASFRGTGSTTVDVSAHLADATNTFAFSFVCARPGRAVVGGGDLITIIGPMPAPVVTFTIGGTVSGLAGTGLVLRNNGTDNLAINAGGAFTFATPINAGSAYNVTVLTQPTGQVCTVQNGSGTAAAAVTNVAVSCPPIAANYTIGGTVSGLAGTGLVLRNNGTDNLAINAGGAFTFATPVNAGSAYNVTVLTQPTGQVCTVQNGSGTAAANVTNVALNCGAGSAHAVNDTGITASQCHQSSAVSILLLDCLSAAAISLSSTQDGMQGRDADPANNNAADGKLGFSFTKIDANGQPLAAGDTVWSCIRDNVTGLMWEVKTANGGLRDWNTRYSNYDSTTQIQDGGAPVTQAVIDAATNSVGFKNAVNAVGLCGASDWRMPTSVELSSLVDYGAVTPNPVIDPTWFPNTKTATGNARYFTSSPAAAGVASLGVDFEGGYILSSGRNSWYVRLVRAVP